MNELTDFCIYINQFVGDSIENLKNTFDITSKAKSINFIIASAIVNSYKGKDYFRIFSERNDIQVKTIQLTKNGTTKESMSFSPINYTEIVKETWETSELRKLFSKTYLFFVFKKNEEERNELYRVILWRMPVSDLEGEVKTVWIKTVECLINGNVIRESDSAGRFSTYFPAQADTRVCHVRPHGTNSLDTMPLPVPDKKTGYINFAKQSFWLNRTYTQDIANSKTGI